MSVLKILGKYPLQEWDYKSKDDTWKVGLWGDYRFTCTCPNYLYRGHSCKHTRDRRASIEQLYGSVYNYVQKLNNKDNENNTANANS